MEVGIRIFNVLHAYVLVAPQLAIDDSLHILIGRLAYEHGAYLFANLETDARLYENNHYVANLLGLAAIGVILPDCDKGRKWRDYARREAERVIRKQVLSDGTGFEGSVRYARLIWEMFALIGLLYERNGLEMSNGYWQRASLLASYLSWMTPDSGESPQIGDNDSGRVLFFSTESYADLRYAACAMGGGGAVCNLPEKMVFASSPQVNQELGELRGLKLFPEGRFSVYRDDEVFLALPRPTLIALTCLVIPMGTSSHLLSNIETAPSLMMAVREITRATRQCATACVLCGLIRRFSLPQQSKTSLRGYSGVEGTGHPT